MKIMLLTPGTGHFYCGSCLRDNALARALDQIGHQVTVIPLYLPLVLEEPEPEPEPGPRPGPEQRVHMGGINMYLQQKTRLARHLPGFVADLLDRPGLLRWASRRANLTEVKCLGAMTLSMLHGEHGRQSKELDKLVESVTALDKPDVIVLSNVLLCGIVRRLKQALDVPVVVTLQGEAPFLDALPQPFKDQCWQAMGERSADIDALVPVSHSYGKLMSKRLGLEAGRIHVVYNGLDLDGMSDEPTPLAQRRPRTIGYLARMCRDKGLHTLVEAFLLLKGSGQFQDLRLRIAGTMLAEDSPFMDKLRRKLGSQGRGGDVDFLPNISRAEKLAVLASLSVLSVPATYGESFGLYLLEAWAAGVPVVQPRHGAFPELIETTGGGVLCEADDPASLAEALGELLIDEPRSQELAVCGRRAVLERFTSERMAHEFEAVCMMVTRTPDD